MYIQHLLHGSGLLLLLVVLRMYLHFILFLKRSWYKKDFPNYFHYSIHHRLKNKQKTWSRSQDTHQRCLKGYLKRPQGSRFTKESVARRKHGHRAKHSVEKYCIIKSQSTLGHIKYIKYQRKARHLFTGCMGTMYIPINCNLTLSINPFPTTHIRPLHTGWSLWYGGVVRFYREVEVVGGSQRSLSFTRPPQSYHTLWPRHRVVKPTSQSFIPDPINPLL